MTMKKRGPMTCGVLDVLLLLCDVWMTNLVIMVPPPSSMKL